MHEEKSGTRPGTRSIIAMMGLAGAMISGTTWAADTGGNQVTNLSSKVPARFDRLAGATYQMGGPLQKQMQGVIDNWLLVVPRANPAMMKFWSMMKRRS